MKQYLDVAAQSKGFDNYEQYFDWVSREDEKPVVTAQLIEALHKDALRDMLTEMLIENYSGNMSIEKWDSMLTDIKNEI